MLRRTLLKPSRGNTRVLLAPAIPRHVWDPQQHDPKWIDSMAKPIADRRAWSAKRYTVGLEPKTPREWLEYSLRNLAYEYNAAMRAAETFPDLIPTYTEMKQRGVKADVDTMYVVLGRAARYEGMRAQDVFRLFDELVALGAKPDIAVIEIMHTAWELTSTASNNSPANGQPGKFASQHFDSEAEAATWRELRRRDLIRWYHRLAAQDIMQYGSEHGLDKLMLQQVRRYRSNLRSLGSVLHSAVWVSVMAHVRDSEDLVTELQALLWERAPPDCSYAELTSPGGRTVTVPLLGEGLSRLVLSSTSATGALDASAGVAAATLARAIEGTAAATPTGEGAAAAAAASAPAAKATAGKSDSELEQSGPSDEQLAVEQAQAATAVLAAASAAAKKQWSIEDESLEFIDDILFVNNSNQSGQPGTANAAAGFDGTLSFSAVTHRRCIESGAAVSGFEDFALNRGVLAALERLVDDPFPINEQTQNEGARDSAVALALVAMSWRSGMLLSADVIAQALDLVRFGSSATSPVQKAAMKGEEQNARRREQDAVRYLRFAVRGTSMANRSSLANAAVAMWRQARCALDDRVVARYIFCRDPWSDVVFCPQMGQQMFGTFSSRLAADASSSSATSSSGASADKAAEGEAGEEPEGKRSGEPLPATPQPSSSLISERWADLMSLCERHTSWTKRLRQHGSPLSRQQQFDAAAAASSSSSASSSEAGAPVKGWTLSSDQADGLVEVMSAAADFLMRMTASVTTSSPALAAGGGGSFRAHQQQHQLQLVRSLDQLFRIAAQLKRDIDITCSAARIVVGPAGSAETIALTPSVECWEALMVVCRNIMDHLVHSRSQDLQLQKDTDALFGQVAALRAQLLNEARNSDKLKMLWLQEA